MNTSLTQELLKEHLYYNKETGLFTWLKITNKKLKVGATAGTNSHGYTVIKLLGKHYRAHRLAWLYEYGTLPVHEIDHINGIKNDNRIVNLRDIPHIQNCVNVFNKRSRTGLQGVSAHSGGYEAKIRLNGVSRYLGFFRTAKEAHLAYLKEKNAYLSRL